MYRRGQSQPMTKFSDAAYINRLRKLYSISTAGSLQFCCINGNPTLLHEGMTHRWLYILLYNFISTCSQPGSGCASNIVRMYLHFFYYQMSGAYIIISTELILHSDLQNKVHYTLQAITPICPYALLFIKSLHEHV